MANTDHRCLPTPFLSKTYQLVDDPSVDEIISWNEDGSTFVVWRPAEFARDLLPKYFKHNNFSSFVRQLNTYGFRKIVPDRWEFANDCFKRGEKKLLCDIQRRKVPSMPVAIPPVNCIPAGSASTSSDEQMIASSWPCRQPTCGTDELIEEIERLRKENVNLTHELTQMKILCDSILMLMSKYATSQMENRLHEGKLMEFLSTRRCSAESGATIHSHDEGISPRLFGVCIGAKRGRNGEPSLQETPSQVEEDQESGAEGKSESMDNGKDRQGPHWFKTCRDQNRVSH